MKAQGREYASWSKKIPCGTQVLVLAKKPYFRTHYCNDWSCEKCSNRKIKELQDEIVTAEIGITLFVKEIVSARSDQEKKSLSNFILRKVRGIYWKIQSDNRIVIIAKMNFLGAVCRNKDKYVIENLVPGILKEKWSGDRQKRITRRQGMKPLVLKNPDPAYAQFLGDRQDEIKEEFKLLNTDRQRAAWLLEHSDEIILYNRGKEIIAQYHAGELQEVQAQYTDSSLYTST